MANTRSTKPEKGNKYYIRKASGGYSTCITGSPKDATSDVLANCVGFANGFWNEGEGQGKEIVPLNCNAKNFIERAISYGLSVYQEPMVGGIMVFGHNTKAGHVAGVYAKPSATQVKTAESGYGSSAFWTATRNKGDGNWGIGSGYYYRGTIAPRDYNPTPTPPVSSELKYKIGDVVVLNGQLFGDSSGNKAGKTVSNHKTTITRAVSGNAYPYNTTGDLGWVAESSVSLYSEPTPPTPEVWTPKVGDIVVPINKVDYRGVKLIQWDNSYEILQIDNRGAVLGAVRGTQRPVWAVLKLDNLRKV